MYTSSIAAIGTHGANPPANEESQFNMGKSGGHYTSSKYLGEVEAMKICKKGLPVVVVNPAMVIGVRDIRPTPSGELIRDVLNRQLPVYFEGGMNYVDVEDVARGHILAAQKGRIGERYILGNQNMTFKEYFNLVAEVGGVEPPRQKITRTPALALAYVNQFVASISKKPPAITPGIARSIGTYAYYDSSKAVKELGFRQTPIRTTVEKAVNWFRENGYVKAA